MKILHTADWHLGRYFFGFRLTEDQDHLLDRFTVLAEKLRPDVVVIAGDLYDRAVPPPDAVELMDRTLSRLVLDLAIPVLAIAGNHDSPERIAFGSRLLKARGLHLAGTVRAEPESIILEDDYGPVRFTLLPYAEPARVRETFGDDSIRDHHRALAALAKASAPAGDERVVIVGHAFVTGGEVSESERPLTVGGTGEVGVDGFAPFAYTALGHLHRPQTVGGKRVRYAGSLMKYSLSEADHVKSASLVTLDGAGEVSIEIHPLTPRRDLVIRRGRFDALLDGGDGEAGTEDYVAVILDDERPVPDAAGRLRKVFPNLVHVERPALTAGEDREEARVDHRRMTEEELFDAFLRRVRNRPLEGDERALFREVAQRLEADRREDDDDGENGP